MNKDNAAQYLPLVQALAEGRTIQVRIDGETEWLDAPNPTFTYFPRCYRIKPEPRRAWVWWPRQDDKDHVPCSRTSYGDALWMQDRFGGHITEVTE